MRIFLWVAAAIAAIAAAALLIGPGGHHPASDGAAVQSSFGGPFTLVGSDGKPFSSERLRGKPYAAYFGFTRCGDVCPTTLSRLVKLRNEAGGEDRFNILFVTIDPANDGPKEVGQYAELFDSPIIGLTGTQEQIDRVKKQYGIFAEPMPNAPMGQQMEHTATVLLFDARGKFAGTISSSEPDSDALPKLKSLAR